MGREIGSGMFARRPDGDCAECGGGVNIAEGVCYECAGKLYHDYCLDGISRQRLFFEFDIERDRLLEAAGFRELEPDY